MNEDPRVWTREDKMARVGQVGYLELASAASSFEAGGEDSGKVISPTPTGGPILQRAVLCFAIASFNF